jgi:hypothetical protein
LCVLGGGAIDFNETDIRKFGAVGDAIEADSGRI